MRDFHDPLFSSEIEPPSERSTGLVLAAVALFIAYVFRANLYASVAALIAAAALSLISFFAARLLAPVNLAWFRLSLLISRVVTPAVMFIIFAVAFVPMGYLMRTPARPAPHTSAPGRSLILEFSGSRVLVFHAKAILKRKGGELGAWIT